MDKWFFEENLGHQEILKRAKKEFGIKASQQTLTAYFRHRERLLCLPDGIKRLEAEEEKARATRLGAGMSLEELAARTLHFTAMAAYEMALAKPDQMRVKEIRSLIKTLCDYRRLMLDGKTRAEKLELQWVKTGARYMTDYDKIPSREQFERTVKDTANILKLVRRNRVENRAGTEERDAENHIGGGAEAETKPDRGAAGNR